VNRVKAISVSAGQAKGLTITELLSLIVILGLAVTMALPLTTGMISKYKLRSAAQEVASAAQSGRMQAISQNNRAVIFFNIANADSPAMALLDDNDNDGNVDSGETYQPLEYLPGGVTFDTSGACAVPNDVAGPTQSASVTFVPSGGTLGYGCVYLKNRYGHHAAVSITLAGSVRIWILEGGTWK